MCLPSPPHVPALFHKMLKQNKNEYCKDVKINIVLVRCILFLTSGSQPSVDNKAPFKARLLCSFRDDSDQAS